MGIKRLSITWNAVRVFQALGLMAVGLLTPLIFTERNFRIYDLLYQAMNELDSGFLALGAIHLIALNTLRSGPDYLAITLLMDGISIQWNGREIPFVKIPFCCLFQISLYQVVYMVYSLRLDIGMPAILVFICIELLTRFSFRLHYKLIIITLFLITVQGLDVLPVMTKLGFGNGEISTDIKAIAPILDAELLLTYFVLLLLCFFATATVLMGLLDLEQQHLIQAHRKAEQDELQLYQARMKNIEMRSFREIQNLVHDLKTPLTTIQGLAGLSEELVEDPKLAKYQRRIVNACDRMGQMVSEILYEDRMSLVPTERLLRLTLSCMASNPLVSRISVHNECPEVRVYVNSIRMARALVNLLENACKAIDPEKGEIQLIVSCCSGTTYWEVVDNGIGINPKILQRMWTHGYSESGSTGLGLSFVQQVVDLHHGTIEVKSSPGEYTRITITLPQNKGEHNGKEHFIN